MNANEFLLRKAERYWNRGLPLPIDLFAQLLSAGLDVEALERKHRKDHTTNGR